MNFVPNYMMVWLNNSSFTEKLGLKPRPSRATFEIIRENQTIVLEDLNVSGMAKNRKLSRAIQETRLEKIPDIFRMDLQKNTVAL